MTENNTGGAKPVNTESELTELTGKAQEVERLKDEKLAAMLSSGDARVLGMLGKNVFVISQETFDEAWRENVEEFDMSVKEAVQDAIEQFKAQGASFDGISFPPEYEA